MVRFGKTALPALFLLCASARGLDTSPRSPGRGVVRLEHCPAFFSVREAGPLLRHYGYEMRELGRWTVLVRGKKDVAAAAQLVRCLDLAPRTLRLLMGDLQQAFRRREIPLRSLIGIFRKASDTATREEKTGSR